MKTDNDDDIELDDDDYVELDDDDDDELLVRGLLEALFLL